MGKVYIKIILLYILLFLCVVTDLKFLKIKNIIVIPFIIMGLLYNFFVNKDCFSYYIIGTFLPFLSLFILYGLKMIGAGDIKLFCAIGSFMGVKFAIATFIISIIFSGIFSIIIIVKNKNFIKSYKKIINYFQYCILNRTLLEYNMSDDVKISLSLPIALGVTVNMLIIS